VSSFVRSQANAHERHHSKGRKEIVGFPTLSFSPSLLVSYQVTLIKHNFLYLGTTLTYVIILEISHDSVF
jgi:hypothetical protein